MARSFLVPLLLSLLLSLAVCCAVAAESEKASPLTHLLSRRHGGTVHSPDAPLKLTSPSSPSSPPPFTLPTLSQPSPTPLLPPTTPTLRVSASNYTLCNTCISLASYIKPFVEDQTTLSVIEKLAIAYCILTKAEGQCSGLDCIKVCDGVVGEWGPIVVDIFSNSSLGAQAVCYDLGQCPAPVPPSGVEGVPVPSNVSDMTGQKQWGFWQTKGVGSILHISDFHFDVLYTAGARTDCDVDLCCRAENGVGTNASNTAGMFGDFRCDSPATLIESLMTYLNATLTPRPDFILYTGDDPAHDVWAQTRGSNLAAIRWATSELQRYFPDVPVFNAVGNHEACPVNEFGGPGVDTWLYSELVQSWSYYLPADAQQTLNYGGYYAALVKPGLYVISLNTNIWTPDDFYVNKNQPVDLSSQLNWFNDTMHQIQRVGARAIIIGHSSPIDWFSEFSSPFNAYLLQYHASILNLFFGHTHHNQVQLYHSDNTTTPHTVGYIGGSVTPYTDTNPGFAVYSYDRALSLPYLVTDAQLHWLNLTDANARLTADWSQTRITATRDYQLSDLSPSSWFRLLESIRTGGAADIYERLQLAWNKGAYSGGQGSERERRSWACESENDQDEAANDCRQQMGLPAVELRAPHHRHGSKAVNALPSCLDARQRVVAVTSKDAPASGAGASMLRTVRSALQSLKSQIGLGKRWE